MGFTSPFILTSKSCFYPYILCASSDTCAERIVLMNYAQLSTMRGDITFLHLVMLKQPNNVYSSLNI